MKRRCLKCGEIKREGEFSQDVLRKDGLRPYCKACRAADQRQRNKLESEARRRLPKKCKSCGCSEPEVEFPSRLSHKCWACHEATAEATKERQAVRASSIYKADREKIRKRHHERSAARKMQLIKMKGGRCESCGLRAGKKWPGACFDFHHREGKEEVIGKLIHSWASMYGRILEEIEKCSLLCSNCHRRLHFT